MNARTAPLDLEQPSGLFRWTMACCHAQHHLWCRRLLARVKQLEEVIHNAERDRLEWACIGVLTWKSLFSTGKSPSWAVISWHVDQDQNMLRRDGLPAAKISLPREHIAVVL